MPTEVPHPQSPEEFDPDKTLFFQRRRKTIKVGPLIIICFLVLGSGALIAWAISQPAKPSVEDIDRTPDQTPSGPASKPVEVSRALPDHTPLPSDPTEPVHAASPPEAAEPPPAVPDTNAPLNLDATDPGNAQVREEVMRRIDLMPGVSAANKDKLYASVDHARSMGRVLTIPFVKGAAVVHPAEIERLKQGLDHPSIRRLADDPTVVFVILGYADPKGSEKVNTEISLSRARSVLDALRDKCGVQNVMHAVAMGPSTLFGSQQADKNRVVEVWAVLP